MAAAYEGVVVVSGLPRSGTSMLMRMLAAGGLPPLSDGDRPADASNPHGYFEYAPVKRAREDASWLPLAQGRAVKIVSFLAPFLPPDPPCRVIHMRRPLDEVLASQAAMLRRKGIAAVEEDEAPLRAACARAESAAAAYWAARPATDVLWLPHGAVIAEPAWAARQLAGYLGGGLDCAAMAAAVDPALHRERGN